MLRLAHHLWWGAPSKLHDLEKDFVRGIAGAGVGGAPEGRSNTCEQRDNCPTLTYQQHVSHPLRRNNVGSFLLNVRTTGNISRHTATPRHCAPCAVL